MSFTYSVKDAIYDVVSTFGPVGVESIFEACFRQVIGFELLDECDRETQVCDALNSLLLEKRICVELATPDDGISFGVVVSEP